MTDNTPSAPVPPPPAPVPMPSPLPPAPASRRGSRASLFLLLGCGGLFALGFVALVVAAAASGSASVSSDSVLKVTLKELVPEHVERTGFDELFGRPVVTVRDHVSNFKKAAADKRIKGVVVRLEPMFIGWAKVEELRDAMVEFKKSGKFLIVYAEFLTEKDYALALAADQIVMPRDAPFEFNGLVSEVSHYPGLLEKLGIEVQYFRYGKYKSVSGESLGRKETTEPVREMINEVLEGAFTHFVDAVAQHRKLPREDVLKLVTDSRLKSDWALEHKLIDKLAYWDEVEADVRSKVGLAPDGKINWVSAAKYKRVDFDDAGLPKGKHTFALVYSQGLIVAGKGGLDPFSGDDAQGSESIIKSLRRAVADKDVKAIIFRVDSPGGAGLGCDYIRREVELAKAKKPVVVTMSDVAASGGYWVAMDASGIVAQPTTYTGSIGIFSLVPSLSGTYEKLGLNHEVFKRGEHADSIIGARKFSDDEAKRFDEDLKASYERFVALAAKGRGKTAEEMEQHAQGRTWLGDKAKALGLVDRVGGFDAAIELAKEKAGIAAADPVKLKLYDKPRGFFADLREEDEDDDGAGPEVSRTLLRTVVEASGYAPLLRQVPGLGVFAREVLANREHTFPLMEHRLDVH